MPKSPKRFLVIRNGQFVITGIANLSDRKVCEIQQRCLGCKKETNVTVNREGTVKCVQCDYIIRSED